MVERLSVLFRQKRDQIPKKLDYIKLYWETSLIKFEMPPSPGNWEEYFRIDEIDTIKSRLTESYYRTSGLRVKFKFMVIYDPSETIMGPFEVHVYSTYLEIQVTQNFCHWQNLLTAARQW